MGVLEDLHVEELIFSCHGGIDGAQPVVHLDKGVGFDVEEQRCFVGVL